MAQTLIKSNAGPQCVFGLHVFVFSILAHHPCELIKLNSWRDCERRRVSGWSWVAILSFHGVGTRFLK